MWQSPGIEPRTHSRLLSSLSQPYFTKSWLDELLTNLVGYNNWRRIKRSISHSSVVKPRMLEQFSDCHSLRWLNLQQARNELKAENAVVRLTSNAHHRCLYGAYEPCSYNAWLLITELSPRSHSLSCDVAFALFSSFTVNMSRNVPN